MYFRNNKLTLRVTDILTYLVSRNNRILIRTLSDDSKYTVVFDSKIDHDYSRYSNRYCYINACIKDGEACIALDIQNGYVLFFSIDGYFHCSGFIVRKKDNSLHVNNSFCKHRADYISNILFNELHFSNKYRQQYIENYYYQLVFETKEEAEEYVNSIFREADAVLNQYRSNECRKYKDRNNNDIINTIIAEDLSGFKTLEYAIVDISDIESDIDIYTKGNLMIQDQLGKLVLENIKDCSTDEIKRFIPCIDRIVSNPGLEVRFFNIISSINETKNAFIKVLSEREGLNTLEE